MTKLIVNNKGTFVNLVDDGFVFLYSNYENYGMKVNELKDELQNRDVIDLLSERHEILRRLAEEKWNKHNTVHISNSEWHILSKIYKNQPTISEVTKVVDFSRQATHKFIKSLAAKGLVEVSNAENSKKHKVIRMTSFGEICYEQNERNKAEIEQQLVRTIGEEQVAKLKNILQLNWMECQSPEQF
ncbi:MarR family transcriptional regulator [Lysinibacillus sp. FSL K6-3209]|uniref:MarR family winged helix-turn-helix transcriptional regulator n=1 Tax=Lysinibacillus sp. FSL K6-3209 TaxID=2921497 RepID=UPI0030DC49D8